MSLMRQRNLWRTAFLGVTGLAIVGECVAAWDGNSNTDPWTDLVTTYVPWELALAVFAALAIWVPAHFFVRYRKRVKQKERAEYEHNPLRVLGADAARRARAEEQGILIQGDTENPNQGQLW